MTPPFSYSSISQFITCPKQYEAQYVLKYVQYKDTTATVYGKSFHSAAEFYIGNDDPLPEAFSFIKPTLDTLKAIKGQKLCEYKLAIAKVGGDYVACEYDTPTRYWRGIADLVIIDDDKAYIIDYKTGKSAKYADTKQLALLAAGVFLKFPAVQTIKAMLLFVVSNECVKANYTKETALEIFTSLEGVLARRAVAYETGVFNASPNGLCKKWCQATRCIHNGNYEGG